MTFLKKTLTFCWLLPIVLASPVAMGQRSILRGEVSLQNSETWTGKRQYITGAQVKDMREKAEARITDNRGQFAMTFVEVRELKTVAIDVIKTGLQVVNTSALTAVAGQEDTVKISMADPASISEYRSRIYKVGKTHAEMRLEQRLGDKEKELAELKKNLVKNAGKIAVMETELSKIQQEREGIDDLALDLARRYNTVNLDDASPLFKNAFNIFQQGNFDSALYLLERIGIEEKVNQALHSGKILEALKAEVAVRDTAQRKVVNAISEVLHLKADLHKANYEFDSTLKCFDLLIQLDSLNVDNLIDYGNFLDWLNRQDDARKMYLKALELCDTTQAAITQLYNPLLARAKANIGIVYMKENNLPLAEAAFNTALLIREYLAATDPRTYEPNVANTQDNLGMLYMKKQDLTKAKNYFDSALVIRIKLAADDSVLYSPPLAESLNKLGVIYSSQPGSADAGSYFLNQALVIYNRLALANNKRYAAEAARIDNNLGVWYYGRQDFKKADSLLAKALEIRRELSRLNPQSNEPDLAATFNNMGSLYSATKEYVKADSSFRQALAIRKKLARDNPDVYEADYSLTLGNLGRLYDLKKDEVNAVNYYREALASRRKLAEKNPGLNEPFMAAIQSSLGVILYRIAKTDEALVCFEEAANIYRYLSTADAARYEPEAAKAINNLATMYALQNKNDKAKSAYVECLQLYRHLAVANPAEYKKTCEAIQGKLDKLSTPQ